MSGSIRGARTLWTARTTTATRVGSWLAVSGLSSGGGVLGAVVLMLVFCAAVATAAAQSPREHTRLNPRGTRVTESQAETVTLTLGTAEVRLLQTWVRTAGTIDKTGKVLS